MMNTRGNAMESPNKANTQQNPMSLDQYDLNPSDYPLGLQLSSSCSYRDAQALRRQGNAAISPQQYQNPSSRTPPLKPSPDPYQNHMQPVESNVEEAGQVWNVEIHLAEEEHHLPAPRTSASPVDEIEGRHHSEGSSEVQFVREIRRSNRIKRTQRSRSKGSLTAHIVNYPNGKGNPSRAQSKNESQQSSPDSEKELTQKSKLTEDGAYIGHASKISDTPHISLTETKKVDSKKKARKISKSSVKKPKSCKDTCRLREDETTGHTKAINDTMDSMKDSVFLNSPSRSIERDRARRVGRSKERNTRNATLNQTCPILHLKSMVTNKIPQGRSTKDNAVHDESDNTLITKTNISRKRCFDQATCPGTLSAGQEVTEIMPNRLRQKRIRQEVYAAFDNKYDPTTTIQHQSLRKRRKELTSSNPTDCGTQNSSEVTLDFAREAELSEELENVPADVAIPILSTELQQLPSIPEPPIVDETDDEDDQYELQSRFGEIREGYIWHSRCGWVMHPSYFERKNFKLCVMHRACKHKIDCQTTRFQMAIIACARNKLTPRELQFLWGTSRTGVAKWASTFRGGKASLAQELRKPGGVNQSDL